MMTLGAVAIVLFILTILSFLIADGATTYMTFLQIKGEMPDYMVGINAALERLGALLLASVIVGVVGAIGLIAFVIPGLIWLVLTAFTIQAIMIDGMDAMDAIKHSINLVKSNAGDVIVFLIVLMIVTSIIRIALGVIPLIGPAIGALVVSTYSSIALTIAYLQLKS